jgi:hypothetical protein
MRSNWACAEPPKVRRHHPELGRQGLYLGLLERPVKRMAVDEHDARSSADVVVDELHVTTP